MAQFNLTIPDAAVPELLDAFAATYGYQTTIPNPVPEPATPGSWTPTIPNPQTKAQFARARVAAYMKDVVRSYRSNTAIEAARVTADQQAAPDITG